ncbi:NUDIX domain-containing protein [Nocardioides pantholopis]|uniref:NUDIX domain-containing protein n=1 Tax=Nocardioides pantholopis TaxID=2483798 RepID=UPI000F0926B6|nr:NUDIX hydrolase [Nocardioides pantholopis]
MTGIPTPLADQSESWPVTATEDLHRDGWVMALRADQVRPPDQPDASPFRRLVLEHPGAVVVLALDDDDRALCLWQYRHPARRRFVELPAGLCDEPGEDPEDVARRELREEAGLEASEWTHLTSTYPSPGILAEVQHLYLARGITEVGRGDFVVEHEEADMGAGWVPFGELLEAVLAGRVTDGPLALATLVAHARGLAGSAARGSSEGVRA